MGKVSRRSNLAAGAVAPIASMATTTDPDAALVDAFGRWQDASEHNYRVEEEEIAAELIDDMPHLDAIADGVAATPAGILVKLAMLAYTAADGYADQDHPQSHIPRLMASLEASADNLPPPLESAVRMTCEEVGYMTRNWSSDRRHRWQAEDDAKEWRTLREIFDRTGITDKTDEIRRQNMAKPRDANGLDDFERRALAFFRKLSEEEQRNFADALHLYTLGCKILDALKALALKEPFAARYLQDLASGAQADA